MNKEKIIDAYYCPECHHIIRDNKFEFKYCPFCGYKFVYGEMIEWVEEGKQDAT